MDRGWTQTMQPKHLGMYLKRLRENTEAGSEAGAPESNCLGSWLCPTYCLFYHLRQMIYSFRTPGSSSVKLDVPGTVLGTGNTVGGGVGGGEDILAVKEFIFWWEEKDHPQISKHRI